MTAQSASQTRRSALEAAARRLRAAGIETPLADARLLLAHALRIDRLALHTDSEFVVDATAARLIEEFVRRRLDHEPVSRIIGHRWFYGRPFQVTAATLDPRPDSETLIDAAKDLFAGRSPRRILDIGTGTGCLLLTLLAEFPQSEGIATDVCSEALSIARTNSIKLGVAGRADFRLGPDFAPVDGKFDLVVSNSPYIPTTAIARLEPEVRNFDPALALDGGPDGLAVYRRLATTYSRYVSDGWIVLEVGHDQADTVARLFNMDSLSAAAPHCRAYKDLAGISRCVAICPRLITAC